MEPVSDTTLPEELPIDSSLDDMMEALLNDDNVTSASLDAKCPKCQNAQPF